jgi:ribonuclease BN (tRNA processing enzyme)
MTAQWRVLGAGSILPRAGYGSSGYALCPAAGERSTLFDCGPGTLRALGAAGLGLADVERVVISHFHPDHCLDLLALAFARRNPALRPVPSLELVGPRGLGAWLERAAALYGEKSWLRFEGTSVREVDPANPGELDCGSFTLSSRATGHTPEALAWRADLRSGGSVTYSGDSGEGPALAELARSSALFVCECSFPDESAVEHHLTPSSAARIARRAAVGTLLLTHFYPELDPEDARRVAARTFDGPIELARDGSVHAIEPGPSHAPSCTGAPRLRG